MTMYEFLMWHAQNHEDVTDAEIDEKINLLNDEDLKLVKAAAHRLKLII